MNNIKSTIDTKAIQKKMFEEYIKHHDELFSGSSFEIGKIHWYIQKTYTEMESKCWIKGKYFLEQDKLTEFGEEVGSDEIHWWVFKKETDHNELLKKTKTTLIFIQKLKEDSFKLKEKYYPASYSDVIKEIKKFTDSHREEIHALYDYVVWLNKKDILAPCILFTYRVWGSTRLSDRTVIITANDIDEDTEKVKSCTEVALGLSDRIKEYNLVKVYDDISYDISESNYPEDGKSITVPEQKLISQTSRKILDELAVYFESLRQSLRNILLDIDKYNTQTKLLYSESFWKSFIKKAVEIKIENQLWDFKETFEMWHMKNKDKEEAEIKFCEQIAAFANEKGGVLIVGITDEIPRKIKGIEGLENKLKFTKSIIKRYINYTNDFVHFQVTTLKNDAGVDRNCLIIAIAQTKDEITVKDNLGRFSCPIRSETGLDRADYEKIKNSKTDVSHNNYDFILDLKQIAMYDPN